MTRRPFLRIERTTLVRALVEVDAGPEWMTDPNRGCYPGNLDDPGIFTSEDVKDLHQAQRICHTRCDFREVCDAWATAHGERHNVWGGVIRTSKTATRKAAA